MEYAYPEVRDYMINKIIRTFSDGFDFDGVFLSIRSHGLPPDHADQYGFNQPVVEEYKRRYGRDILREDFDVEKWRELRGEYFTLFLRELKAHLKTKGQKLSIGVQQGEYIGPPFGNMRLQWRQWIEEGIIDGPGPGPHHPGPVALSGTDPAHLWLPAEPGDGPRPAPAGARHSQGLRSTLPEIRSQAVRGAGKFLPGPRAPVRWDGPVRPPKGRNGSASSWKRCPR